MVYNPYFPANYQPYQMQQPQMAQPAMQQQQGNSFQNGTISAPIWVQGEAGAKSYLVAPNQTVQLWDSEAPVIYLKSADQAGIPSMRIIDYTFRDSTPQTSKSLDVGAFATKDDVDSLRKELDALRANFEVKGKEKK